MNVDETAEEQRERTAEAYRQAGLTLESLWLHYFSIGGDAGELEIDAYLNRSYMLRPVQRDLLDHAVHELDGH
ncbi:hypothetical protein ACLKOZ_05725 [Arthrobacter sp. R4]|uniref:hypothetical protein n=1 Tax=Micrococcaceae TaxID=1268 RepID=UPI0035DEC718